MCVYVLFFSLFFVIVFSELGIRLWFFVFVSVDVNLGLRLLLVMRSGFEVSFYGGRDGLCFCFFRFFGWVKKFRVCEI